LFHFPFAFACFRHSINCSLALIARSYSFQSLLVIFTRWRAITIVNASSITEAFPAASSSAAVIGFSGLPGGISRSSLANSPADQVDGAVSILLIAPEVERPDGDPGHPGNYPRHEDQCGVFEDSARNANANVQARHANRVASD
jgi:hypothetical protein